MRQWALALVLAGISATATACPDPAPSGWKPPVVESLSIDPTSIATGQTFHVTTTATDDKAVRYVTVRFYIGAPGQLVEEQYPECVRTTSGSAASMTVELECVMPADAPTGGWNVVVGAIDFEYVPPPPTPSGSKLVAFTVTGGQPIA